MTFGDVFEPEFERNFGRASSGSEESGKESSTESERRRAAVDGRPSGSDAAPSQLRCIDLRAAVQEQVLKVDRRKFIQNSLMVGGALAAGKGLAVAESATQQQIPGAVSPELIAAARFPKDFLWGTATSSYQVEGAWNTDGKSDSIWDRAAHTPGKIFDGSNADVSCDQFHRYKEDVAIMKSLNMKSYRFSTSWPRILPMGTGQVNQKGLDYYSRLVDVLLQAGIRPFCTIYHWDLPQALEDRGGWPNRDLASYYADFAAILAKNLGDRITVWAPFNMPGTFTFRGYGTGWNPPYRANYGLFLKAAHTVNLAQGMAFRAIKAASSKASLLRQRVAGR